MADYKDTINLPQTDFPMKASLAQREPERLAWWDDIKLYQQLRELGRERSDFILHDGPPYANARPHMGTALNKTLKDIVMKSKTLSGYNTPYVPGWDCHGLPIELNVEKKVGKPGEKVTPNEFRDQCREYALTQVDLQRDDFKRLGVLGDWDNPYLTLNRTFEANTVRSLAQMIERGHLKRGSKPVYWCVDCGSALAEAEVEYKDKTSPAIDVLFDAVDVVDAAGRFGVAVEGVSFPIWTTTPWTLPANQAVAVNGELEYVLVKLHHRNAVFAKDMLDNVMQRYGIEDYNVLATVKGDALNGIVLQHPFMNRTVPVILGEHVTTEAGTGCVHTAPAHGLDDYNVGLQNHLPVESPLNSRAKFDDNTPLVGGMFVRKANEPIIEGLEASGHLLFKAEYPHSYPHCWRHKTPLIFRATPQWFISMEQAGLREQALNEIENVEWLPSWGKTRIHNMVAGRPDWCISRQRCWGIPIPLFTHKDTGEPHPDTLEIMRNAADLIEKEGINAWFDADSDAFIAEADDYDKCSDILDVWFDSGATQYSVLEQREELHVPADMYLEGSDQHRGWFQSSLLESIALRDRAPYKTVLTHGYVVDAQGRKMSKSLGNTMAPSEIVEKYGADILRLWVAASDFTNEINVSDEILKRSADAYRRLRNTARFLLGNLFDFTAPSNVVVQIDQWAIVHTQQVQEQIIAAYEKYDFAQVYQLILNFCSREMGSFYLDIIKDRLYTCKKDSAARRSAQTAMYHIVQALALWLAPICSFTAEEIWQHIPGEREQSVFMAQWYTAFPVMDVDHALWTDIIATAEKVNEALENARNDGVIKGALEAEVALTLPKHLRELGDEWRFITRVSDVELHAGDETTVSVNKTTAEKCVRCYQHRTDVNANKDYPDICGRCVENVAGDGETRKFA